jgi:hypothetical protein
MRISVCLFVLILGSNCFAQKRTEIAFDNVIEVSESATLTLGDLVVVKIFGDH